MELRYTYWKSGNLYVGYLDDYPERKTQGENIEDLEEALKELYEWIMDGTLPVEKRKGILLA
jgi:predicted RNase H-like HicB family nuclease